MKDCNTDADCIIGTGASSTDLGPCEVQVKDGCTPECKYNVCGDGMVDNHYDGTVEQCDDENLDNNDNCKNNCLWNVCGDGIVNYGVEECDDGNFDESDGCTTSCVAYYPHCGDGVVQSSDNEQCDDGKSCLDGTDCSVNGICNDGSSCLPRDGDGCNHLCQYETCGDGVLQPYGADGNPSTLVDNEECDDGNILDGDGCSANCKNQFI